ncbi:hypothetical protein NUW54_g719 [Trametes sanguinea]|uniref:Uncharacterized protein n=1 Tax=Trametes sanguinea TaxID=158606 RepID=A0ACC1Q8Y7_9APHY|nr:hypothetical protein NUW54_g719 [Trametes sanguinea]
MGATSVVPTANSQWLFPVSALYHTPSRTTSNIPLEKELYDRSRGVEFLYRLGVSLGLPSSAMYTAATWFHRFYMRYSMEDYHRQDVAASCIFLATKTEECGRKLRDVAKVVCSKVSQTDVAKITDDSKEVEECQTSILLTEEVLLEGLCFDFIVDSPQADLVDLFEACPNTTQIEECAWSIANDSPKRPAHPRRAIEYFGFNEMELLNVADALTILLEFYGAQDLQNLCQFLASVASIPPPHSSAHREKLYKPFAHVAALTAQSMNSATPEHVIGQSGTPVQGGTTPGKLSSGEWKPVTEPAP